MPLWAKIILVLLGFYLLVWALLEWLDFDLEL